MRPGLRTPLALGPVYVLKIAALRLPGICHAWHQIDVMHLQEHDRWVEPETEESEQEEQRQPVAA